MREKCQVIWLW